MAPTLFSLYVNDVVNLPLSGRLLLYADDIVLFNSNEDMDLLVQMCNSDLQMAANRSNFNKRVVSINCQV